MCEEHGSEFTARVCIRGSRTTTASIDTCPVCKDMRRTDIPYCFTAEKWRNVVRERAKGAME